MKAIFKKDYYKFKKGQYLEVPERRFTGQIRVYKFWEFFDDLLKKKIIEIN